ncbi:MAG: hypothetical protein BJ554DRAFT_2424 [Olpidium bornovanus]|uniref:Uncharacterized protein n=1 Tax=Olpidium bornovanus TaxID=278681 RepID=A0A8H8A133_9FUNG|nr:MAG: hypothetical protein BJ554DRAFT_2424 [Olpidium bornovanus]
MASYLDHEADTATWLSALESVDPECVAELLDNYGSYLQDAEAEITRHCATPGHHTPQPTSFLQRDASPREPPRPSGEPALDAVWTSCLRISDDESVRSGPGYQDFVPLHDAAANDPLLQGLFVEVGRFFARPPEVNLELIGVLSTLAGLGVEELDGGPAWGCNEDEEDYMEPLLDGGPPPAAGQPPRIFASLCALAENVERHRSDLEETQPGGFAKALRRRRKDLLTPPPGSGNAEIPVSAPTAESPTPAASPERFLDNVVILQEAVKELMAIVQVRRAIPVEGIRYV